MTLTQQRPPPSRSPWRLLLLIGWVALIFGTSCTVIRTDRFFVLMQRYVVGEEAMEQFRLFWGVWWFIIVKGWHLLEFSVLLLLSVAAWKWWFGQFDAWSIGGAMVFCLIFAISDEWHQTFVPDRFGTVMDVLIDALGVLLAGAVLLRRVRTTHRTQHAS